MKPGYKVGDLIWARVKTHPAWPSRIEPQPKPPKKGQVYVYFFGAKPEDRYRWVVNSYITKYDTKDKVKLMQASTKPDFKLGIEEIEAEYQKLLTARSASVGIPEREPDTERSAEETQSEPAKRSRQPTKRYNIDTEDAPSNKTPKASKNATTEAKENGEKAYSVRLVSDDMKNDDPFTIQPIERPDLSSLGFSTMPQEATSKYTIGFLGLGIMSSGMINNLIRAGYKVNLWNRTNDRCYKLKEKCDAVKEGRVNVCVAPCDVMKDSDIVFNCVSDPESAKKNVLDNCGVAYGNETLLEKKGFVEMTGIDPHTSLKLCEAIESKGGRYLEAQLQGSRQEAADGTLVILAAGDDGLFEDCQSCFKVISKASLFLGPVGVATKAHLILQLMQGISLVGLAEGLVLAERCGISGKDIINIFSMTNLASPYLKNKANKIVNQNFKEVEQSINNMQKDIRLALGLSDELMQPLMLGSAANEVFKHSRKLGYDDHDCSCIYKKARY